MIKNNYSDDMQIISVIRPSVGSTDDKEILKLSIDSHYINSSAVAALVDKFIKEFNSRYATRV